MCVYTLQPNCSLTILPIDHHQNKQGHKSSRHSPNVKTKGKAGKTSNRNTNALSHHGYILGTVCLLVSKLVPSSFYESYHDPQNVLALRFASMLCRPHCISVPSSDPACSHLTMIDSVFRLRESFSLNIHT